MQYPPQQPTNQPYYPPSEVYLYEQSQTYLPAQEITQPRMLAQEIAIYPNRKQAIWRTTVCAICLLVLILIIPFFFIVNFVTGQSFGASDIAPLILAFAFLLAAITFIGWITWRMASELLFKRKPILVINSRGITVRNMPMLSGFFITWTEIEALSFSHYSMYKYLCIIPKNPDQFLSRFSSLERFNRRINSRVGSPLYIAQILLVTPVEEILQTLYHMLSLIHI
mgnify:CR=1 FL=1